MFSFSGEEGLGYRTAHVNDHRCIRFPVLDRGPEICHLEALVLSR